MASKSSQSQPQPQPTGAESATDGRVLRGARNKQLIVNAVYDLLRGGSLEPTAQDVAQRAGVGVRTVFRQFQDMDALALAVGDRVMRELIPILVPLIPSGQLQKDLAAIIDRRSHIFEHLAPFRRAGSIVRHRSAFLRGMDATITRMQREDIDRMIKPYLEEDCDAIMEALDMLLSFEAWDRMRERQRLSRKRTEEVLLTATLALTQGIARKTGRRR